MKHIIRLLIYVLVSTGIITLDQLTKQLALAHLETPLELFRGLSLVLTKNRGISWGMLYANSSLSFILLGLLVASVIGILAFHTYDKWRQRQSVIGEFLVLSGALSNLFDRVFYQGVVDFIEFSCCGWYWPAFNLADCAIVVGVGIMLYEYWNNN